MPKPRRVNKMMGRDYGQGIRKIMANPKNLNSSRSISKEEYKILNKESKIEEEKEI